jgi:hypothetical protein
MVFRFSETELDLMALQSIAVADEREWFFALYIDCKG